MDVIQLAGSIAGLLAFIGLIVLSLLVFTQARELRRFGEERAGLRESEPVRDPRADSHPAALQVDGADSQVAPELPPVPPGQNAERLRAATRRQPSPRGLRRRFPRGMADPRVASFLVALVVVLGGIGLVVALTTGGSSEPATGQARTQFTKDTKTPPPVPGTVSVSVLNATSVGGLGGQVNEQLAGAGFEVGAAQNADRQNVDRTEVFFAPGERPAAEAVASTLQTGSPRETPADISAVAPGFDVVVLVGRDQATS